MGIPSTYLYQDNISSRASKYWSGNLNFMHKFDKKGEELQGLLYLSHENGDDISNQINYNMDINSNPIDKNPYKYRSNESPAENEIRAKLDYILPINGKDKLEAGYQGRIQRTKEDFIFEEFNYTSANWVNNPKYSSLVDYAEDIHAMYGTMKFSGSSYGTNFENQFKFKRESQIVQLTLSYKINNFNSKSGKDGPDSSGNEGGGMGEF